MSNNFETNDNFIEARYLAETNQYDLELMVAAPNIVDFGSGTNNLTQQSTLAAITAGPNRNVIGCPRLDQYTLAWNIKEGFHDKQVEFLTTDDFLYNPITQTVHKLRERNIVLRQKCYLVEAKSGAKIIASGTQPMIQNFDDKKGLQITHLAKNSKLLSYFKTNGIVVLSSLNQRIYQGVFDCLSIKLEDGHIFACGMAIEEFLLLHNAKPFPELVE